MKKRHILLSCTLLVASLLLLLCGCSSYTGIRTAFEDAGYIENESLGAYQQEVAAAIGSDFDDVCTVHLFTRAATGLGDIGQMAVALILEFHSTDEMNRQIEASETLKGLIKDVQTSDYVSGNCVLLVNFGSDTLDIFKSTK